MLYPDKAIDVVLLSCDAVINRGGDNPWEVNATLEDKIVEKALNKREVRTEIRSWSDPSVNWAEVGCVLVRTPWDYNDDFPKFLSWMQETAKHTHFLNPIDLLIWNIDKHYLQDLEKAGVSIVPSLFIEIGEERSLTSIIAESGWEEVVLKPCVSAGARHTYRLKPVESDKYENIFRKLILQEAMILQPFIKDILNLGEYSFMYINGKYSFTTCKKAKEGDYRVQDDFGGTVALYKPSQEEKDITRKMVEACPVMPLYARVDCIPTKTGELLLSEIELIEPELWFRLNGEAAEDLADALIERLTKKQAAY
ncbi:MAG: hypothetical protein AAGC85_17765 [Bacteroidota bacterium]